MHVVQVSKKDKEVNWNVSLLPSHLPLTWFPSLGGKHCSQILRYFESMHKCVHLRIQMAANL